MSLAPPQSDARAIRQRLFLVGYPRSGTTLLQCLIAAHSEIVSFPETHFFRKVIARYPRRRRLGLADKNAIAHLRTIAETIGVADAVRLRRPQPWLTLARCTRHFIALLDVAARRAGVPIWLEKTPSHLRYIETIAALVPDARFIHIVRNGPDAIASLYDVSHRYPDAECWAASRQLDRCIRRWIEDLQRSVRYLDDPRHLVVSYDRLIASPSQELPAVFQFIGTAFEPAVLETYRESAQTAIAPGEAWKASNLEPLRANSGGKFERLFDRDTQAHIRRQLAAVQHLYDRI